ncbi:MAG TPA: efflux RND transporter periplasmic adaptor subunit [Rhizomicrobium sp.]|nr:efflux RND transporter periplasmic adaptor subunit [Rhizomicrobium sp.]
MKLYWPRALLDRIKQLFPKLDNVSRTKWSVAGLVLVLLGVGMFYLWPSTTATAQQKPPEKEATLVAVIPVKIVRMAPKMALAGTVIARNDSKLASEVEGRVAWVAEVGSSVKEGDVVARLSNNVLAMQLASQKANVARLSASLRYNRGQAARMQRLYSSKAIAQSQRDEAVSARDMTAAELGQAKAQLEQTQYQFDHSEIRAPFNGNVAARLINAGEYASPGKEIVRLVDINSIEVKAQAPIDIAHFLHQDQAIKVQIQDKTVDAHVRAIVPVGDELSRTVEVRLTLAPGAALVGDAAKVMVPSARPHTVLAVPRDALILREESTYIFKVNAKGEAARVAIETGSEDSGLVEVKGKIAKGDSVIVQGAELLEPGQKVRVNPTT